MKTASAPAMHSAGSLVNRRRPRAVPSATSSERPGSWNGTTPCSRSPIFSKSKSVPTTSWPSAAKVPQVTKPTCPVPMTPTRIRFAVKSVDSMYSFTSYPYKISERGGSVEGPGRLRRSACRVSLPT